MSTPTSEEIAEDHRLAETAQKSQYDLDRWRWHMCSDPDGPRYTQRVYAEAVGVTHGAVGQSVRAWADSVAAENSLDSTLSKEQEHGRKSSPTVEAVEAAIKSGQQLTDPTPQQHREAKRRTRAGASSKPLTEKEIEFLVALHAFFDESGACVPHVYNKMGKSRNGEMGKRLVEKGLLAEAGEGERNRQLFVLTEAGVREVEKHPAPHGSGTAEPESKQPPRAKNFTGKTNQHREREIRKERAAERKATGNYSDLINTSLMISQLCLVLEGVDVSNFELDLHTFDRISNMHDDLVNLSIWTERALLNISGWLGEVKVRETIKQLRNTKGRSPEEAALFLARADKLERKLEARLESPPPLRLVEEA